MFGDRDRFILPLGQSLNLGKAGLWIEVEFTWPPPVEAFNEPAHTFSLRAMLVVFVPPTPLPRPGRWPAGGFFYVEIAAPQPGE